MASVGKSKSKTSTSTRKVQHSNKNLRPVSQGQLANGILPLVANSQIHGSKSKLSGFSLQNRPSVSQPASMTSTTRVLNTLSTSQRARRLFANVTKSAMIKMEQNREYRNKVEQAIRDHKVFSIIGCFPAIRRGLVRRGWVEKKQNASKSLDILNQNHILSWKDYDFEGESDAAWINRVLRDYPPDLIWTYKRDNISWNSLTPSQAVNRFTKVFFTSKVGIATCVQTLHWFTEPNVAHTNFPRCYHLSVEEEKMAFVADFRLTACMNILKWLIVCHERNAETGIFDPNGTVPSICIDFAISQLEHYVKIRRHEDLDWTGKPIMIKSETWGKFLHQCDLLVYQGAKLIPDASSAKRMYELARHALKEIAPFWPQLNIDGAGNIWICKPGALSRGTGIVLHKNLEDILSQFIAKQNISNWVVQKYIERPLLIYKTKFDIRQWFLVTEWCPLTVWFYKESYARFCSKPFSIDDFHESVHLCNNAVQNRYTNSETRDRALPEQNMWDNYTFQAYLKSIGKEDLWDKWIYPGMKQGILAILLSFQEYADFRKNSFELYGADFMISDDFVPWLIEINSSPCMAATTKVTARMCSQCQDDCLKVIIDRRQNRNASTGLFELMYQQTTTSMPMNPVGSFGDIVIYGRAIKRDIIDNTSLHSSKLRRRRRKKKQESHDSPSLGGVDSTFSQIVPDSTEVPLAHLVRRLRLTEPRKRPGANNSAISSASVS